MSEIMHLTDSQQQALLAYKELIKEDKVYTLKEIQVLLGLKCTKTVWNWTQIPRKSNHGMIQLDAFSLGGKLRVRGEILLNYLTLTS